jgi:HEPN domain-containing protein/predicted nucleotidyltransferase
MENKSKGGLNEGHSPQPLNFTQKPQGLNTSLTHLPDYKQAQLREITDIIKTAVDSEKVILFGSHATGRWVEHRYVDKGVLYEYVSDYDILVITRAGNTRKDYEVQDIIENRCIYKTPVTVIVHDIEFVNKMLNEGQYFFTDIEQEGIMLYDAGNTPLAERRPLTPAEAQAIAQQYYEQWFESAKGFLEVAEICLQKRQLKIGAFNLHQAAERTYNAVILVHTGHKPKTHNLDKLRRLCKRFSEGLAAVFADNTAEMRHLFDLLKRGYVDARYKEDYTITMVELQALIKKVSELQQEAEILCEVKIRSFLK